MAAERFDLAYTPVFGDLLELTTALPRQRYKPGQRLRMSAVMVGLFVAGATLAVLVPTALDLFTPVPGWVGIVVVVAGVMLAFRLVVQPWLIKTSGAMIEAARPAGFTRFVADATGLRWTASDYEFALHWRGVEKLFATSKNLAFMSGAVAFAVPLDQFEDAAQQRAFVQFALSHLPPEIATASRNDRSLRRLLESPSA